MPGLIVKPKKRQRAVLKPKRGSRGSQLIGRKCEAEKLRQCPRRIWKRWVPTGEWMCVVHWWRWYRHGKNAVLNWRTGELVGGKRVLKKRRTTGKRRKLKPISE